LKIKVVSWFSLVIRQNTNRQLVTSSENIVASAQFLIALATSESQFRALILALPVTLIFFGLLALKKGVIFGSSFALFRAKYVRLSLLENKNPNNLKGRGLK